MGDTGNMKAKEPRISVRVDNDLKTRIETVCKQTGVDEADIVRNCIIALCDSVEKNGTITFPLQITSGKDKGCGTDAGCAGHPEETKFSSNEKPPFVPMLETRPISHTKNRK